MKTSSSTIFDSNGRICVTHKYRLAPAEKAALIAISKGLYKWGKPGYVNIRYHDSKTDESGGVSAKTCHALHKVGLLDDDPMAYHGYQFNINGLGRQVAAKLQE